LIKVSQEEILRLKTQLPPVKEALARFGNERIRAFVREAMEKAPDGFWLSPSSSSGKYHPPADNVIPGGLVNHVLIATYFVGQGIRRYPEFTDEECRPDPKWLDRARAAAMLHDIAKNGIPWGRHTVPDHGHQGARFLAGLRSAQALDPLDRTMILRGVKWHMGRWEAGFDLITDWGRFDTFQLLIQEADFYSTRKQVRVAWLELINYEYGVA